MLTRVRSIVFLSLILSLSVSSLAMGQGATALIATAQSASAIQLKWTDPNSTETGFRIERSTNSATWTPIDIVGSNVITYMDTGRSQATLYYYRVIAFSGTGDAASSNIAAATTFALTPARICRTFVNPNHTAGRWVTAARNNSQWALAWADKSDGNDSKLMFQLLNASTGAPVGSPLQISNDDMGARFPVMRWNGSNFGLMWLEHTRTTTGLSATRFAFALLDASGTKVRGDVRIRLTSPNLGINNDGEMPLVWDGSGWGVFLTDSSNPPMDLVYFRLDADGDLLTGPVSLTNTTDLEYDVTAAWNGSQYGLAWVRQHDQNYQIYFQRMQNNGTLIGSSLILQSSSVLAYSPNIIWDGSGWAVAWVDIQMPDGNEVIHLARLDSSGGLIGSVQQMSPDYTSFEDEFPKLFVKPGGGYVAYTSSFNDSTGIYEIGRLEADSGGVRTGARTLISNDDSKGSWFERAATDGTNFVVAWEDSGVNVREIADVVVDGSGAPAAPVNDVTTNHNGAVVSAQPAVAPFGDGFVALWNERVQTGTQIYGKIFDGIGSSTPLLPLTTSAISRRPALVPLGNSFAVAWNSAGQALFDRYDSTGAPLFAEVQVAPGPVRGVSMDFSGEAFGVAWIQGGIRFQRVSTTGALIGSQVVLSQTGPFGSDTQIQWTGSGWAIVWVKSGNLYYAKLDPSGAVLVSPIQLTFSNTNNTSDFRMLWNGTVLGLTWSENRGPIPPGQDIYFTVVNQDGTKAFPEIAVVSNYYDDATPFLYWKQDRFRLVYPDLVAGMREKEILTNGTLTSFTRFLGNHGELGAVAAYNGATLALLWQHQEDMYFQTTECLEDISAPACPAASLNFTSQINLTWSASTDAQSGILNYNIYRDGTELAETLGTTTSFNDGGFTIGGTHVYEVRAYNGAYLESAGCSPLMFNCPAITVSPSSLPAGTTGIAYSQTVTASGGSGPFTFNISADSLPSGLTLSAAGIISGVPSVSGTSSFTVRAVNSQGCAGTRAYTIFIGPTAPATALVATTQSSSSIQLKWTDPNGSETGFRIERSLNSTTWTPIDIVGANTTLYLNTGLAASTLYYYRVIAYNGSGDAGPSNIASATTFPAVAAKVCIAKVSPDHTWARYISLAHNGTQWAAAWQQRVSATNDEIFFQMMNANGTFAGSPVQITSTDMPSINPVLKWNGTHFGLLHVEAMRGPAGQATSKPFFALLDGAGVVVRKTVRIPVPETVFFSNSNVESSLVWDGGGWGIFLGIGANPSEMYYYRLDEDGDVIAGPVQLTNTPEYETDIAAAWNGSEYGIAWLRSMNDVYDIYFQRMQSNGTLLGTPALLGHNASGLGALAPSVVWNGTGWAVAWLDVQGDVDGSEIVFLAQVNASGGLTGSPVRISEDSNITLGVYDENPMLFNKPGGGYVIYTQSNMGDTGIYEIGRLEADASGNRVGSRIVLTSNDGYHSMYPHAATDGTNFLIGYNDHTAQTEEIADLLVNASGAIVSGPNALTSGHSAGNSFAIDTSTSPAVAAFQNGFVALWNEFVSPLSNRIYGKIYDGSGASISLAPLSTRSISGKPAVVSLGNTFAAAWRDATGNLVFNRYNASGTPVISEATVATGAGPSPAMDFSGEVFGVAWRQGGLRFQRIAADGSLVGSTTTIATPNQGGNLQMQWVGSGWALVWRNASNLFYARLDPSGAIAVPPLQITFSSGVLNQFQLLWNGAQLGLVWTEYSATADPPGVDTFFTVLGTDGIKTIPVKNLVSTVLADRNPAIYWNSDRFRVVYSSSLPDGLREIQVMPDGTIVGSTRQLSNRGGVNSVAWNGATLGILWSQINDLFFETTECLNDVSAPACPSSSSSSDGQKITVNWSAGSDPQSGIYRYNIYRDGTHLADLFAGTTSFDDYGFHPGASTYEVRALNGAFLESTGCTLLQYNCPSITVNPPTLPGSVISVFYTQTITATGGVSPNTFSVLSGTLPPGLTLSSAGVLSGTPSATGVFTFIVRARDANGCPGIRSYTITIGTCLPPDERIYLYSVILDINDNPVLNFQDPNQPNQVTGYNIYRATAPSGPWNLVGSNIIDMDEGTPNKQWVDSSGDPGTFYYQVAAYNSVCPAEGPL